MKYQFQAQFMYAVSQLYWRGNVSRYSTNGRYIQKENFLADVLQHKITSAIAQNKRLRHHVKTILARREQSFFVLNFAEIPTYYFRM
jgi:hypothetical protein